jgi:hypothetical protein
MRGGGVAPKGAAPASLRAWVSFRRKAVSLDPSERLRGAKRKNFAAQWPGFATKA